MSVLAAKVVADGMNELGIEYGFGVYANHPIIYPYFVGEYTETESFREDGLQETTFILNGFSRESWFELEKAADKIREYFNKVSGKTVIAENGSAVVVFYANSLIIPTGDSELKRIQINLSIKEWMVN